MGEVDALIAVWTKKPKLCKDCRYFDGAINCVHRMPLDPVSGNTLVGAAFFNRAMQEDGFCGWEGRFFDPIEPGA